MTQGIQKQVGILSVIESESHLFTVGLQALRAAFVPCSNDAALEKREHGFNGIGVHVALGIDVTFVKYIIAT